MVRLLLIRHGENAENVMLAYVNSQVRKQMLTETEAINFLRVNITEFADGPLTPRGLSQAEALGAKWGPALVRYQEARQGSAIHLFVSPVQRALQTIDPLARCLGKAYTVVPDLAEIHATVARDDRLDWMPKIREAEGRGDYEQVEVWMESMEGHWKAAGLNEAEIRSRFPLAMLDFHGLVHTPFPQDGDRWCRWGPEGTRRQRLRMKRVAAWLESLRESLPEDDIVCVVSHGGTMTVLLREIFAGGDDKFNFEGHDNTSVTSVRLDKQPWQGEKSKGAWHSAPYRKYRMEFMNRVDHLHPMNGPLNEMDGLFMFGDESNPPTRMRFEND